MESLFEELGGTYHQEGDYFLPDLSLPETAPVGTWGQRRRHYLKAQRRPLYNALLLSGKLNDHLIAVDAQAKAMFFQLVKRLAEQEGVAEQLKVENQMEWVGRINNIRDRATEIVHAELIFTR
ncbi:TnpV protein [Pseudoflavonifractor sp. 60]|uniref:TnpV protein n=1 Tax=Pseudoflavonifractor sp. 60 TaxID=2304576 RepID=UPI001368DA0F|nr:TnpV protein [Pseudoflavonifractor sp. 60]NBI67643.1 TnpV protein [Pseudoflavonifractor sp. 60]